MSVRVGVSIRIAVDDQPDIRLIGPVSRTRDVVERRLGQSAVLLPVQLGRMSDEPDMHPVRLGEALHLAEQLRRVLGLVLILRPFVLDLVVGVAVVREGDAVRLGSARWPPA